MKTVKINKDRYNALRWAINYSLKDKDMDICEISSCFDEKLEWGVNWCALGATTPAETVRFAEDLQKAAETADALNEMMLEVTWEGDEALNKLIEENMKEARRRYTNFKKMVADQLEQITALDPASFEPLYELLTDYTI